MKIVVPWYDRDWGYNDGPPITGPVIVGPQHRVAQKPAPTERSYNRDWGYVDESGE